MAPAEATASVSFKMLQGERWLNGSPVFREKEEGQIHFKIAFLGHRFLTFSRRSGSPLHSEFTDTLNDFQAGLKLFITTWERDRNRERGGND